MIPAILDLIAISTEILTFFIHGSWEITPKTCSININTLINYIYLNSVFFVYKTWLDRWNIRRLNMSNNEILWLKTITWGINHYRAWCYHGDGASFHFLRLFSHFFCIYTNYQFTNANNICLQMNEGGYSFCHSYMELEMVQGIGMIPSQIIINFFFLNSGSNFGEYIESCNKRESEKEFCFVSFWKCFHTNWRLVFLFFWLHCRL